MYTFRYPGLAALIFALAFACSSGPEPDESEGGLGPQPIVPGTKKGGLTVEKGDVSGDGKPDVWNYYKDLADPADPGATIRVLVKKEADLDFDGRKDITRIFDDGGVLLEEEADLDFDGNRDQVNIYTKGILVEKRLYRSGKDRVFIWKFYQEGKMVRLNRDDNGDGRADYCELWYAGEKLSKKGWDKDGDGECDYWESAE